METQLPDVATNPRWSNSGIWFDKERLKYNEIKFDDLAKATGKDEMERGKRIDSFLPSGIMGSSFQLALQWWQLYKAICWPSNSAERNESYLAS